MSVIFSWQIDSDVYRNHNGWQLRSGLEVELFGEDRFLAISLSTEGYEDGVHCRQVSRSTAVAEPGEGAGGSLRRYNGLVVNSYLNPDRYAAASLALSGHLWGYLLDDVAGDGFAAAAGEHEWVRAAYGERVAEPIATATLAFCRSPLARQAIEPGKTYWCISRWTLEGTMAQGAVAKAFDMGFLAQDILVIDANHPELHRVKTALLPGGRNRLWP